MGGVCCGPQVHDEPTTSVINRDPEQPPLGYLLVFVNPNSGAGKGIYTFHYQVGPQLRRNNINYELVITTGPNEARDIMRSRKDLNLFHGVIILSGDGLVYEVLNGLAERDDAETLIPNLPIGIVPSGSGNGLLSSIFAAKGWSLRNPVFMDRALSVATSINAEACPVNLMHCETGKEDIAAFLSVGWGLMADIDIESERWRKTLGSNRFVAGALIRCLKLRTYRGRLSYKPFTRRDDWVAAAPYDVYSSSSRDMIPSHQLSQLTSTSSLPANADVTTLESLRISDKKWFTSHKPQVPSIEEPIPEEEWITIEDEFVGVYAVTLSHISADGPFMPKAKLDDERIYLTYVLKKDVGNRCDLIDMLSAIEKEKHLSLKFFNTVEVSSFRLEPITEGSMIVVDGEVVDATKIQATITDLRTAVFS